MSTTVKHFHSAMTGAPTLSGTAGSLIAVLDACLKDGFGLKTADSVVVSGGIATVNISSGHSFAEDVIMLVSGATPAGLNGEKRVLTTSTNTITFDATGISDQTATGTITAKLAPVGWEKPFSGTNLAAYRSTDVTGTRMYLRVDDTGTTEARVVCYESMTDVNTGVRASPSATQAAGGGYWPKANAANATARAWTLIADSRGFILHTHTHTTSPGVSGAVWAFGDFDSYKSGDPYACHLFASNVSCATTSGLSYYSAEACSCTGVVSCFVPRSFTGLGGSVPALHATESYFTGTVATAGVTPQAATPQYPNGPNNALITTRKLILEDGVGLRGVMRGLLVSPQGLHARFNWLDKVDGQGGLLGRKLLAIKCGGVAGTASQGVAFVDITGPWGA